MPLSDIARAVEDVQGDPTEAGFRMKQQLCLRGVPFWVKWDLVEADAPSFARFEGRMGTLLGRVPD